MPDRPLPTAAEIRAAAERFDLDGARTIARRRVDEARQRVIAYRRGLADGTRGSR